MIGRTTRYAFQILGFLAGRQDERVSGGQIAKATGIPANYLSKILNQLRKSGFVDSRKGWHGGFRLRPVAGQRTVRDVVAVIEGGPGDDEPECVFGFPQCDPSCPCSLHDYWERIHDEYEAMLDRTQVDDLAQSRRGSRARARR